MFLHLIPPDDKFYSFIHDVFESALPGEHTYWLHSSDSYPEGEYPGFVTGSISGMDDPGKFLRSQDDCEAILVQYLDASLCSILSEASKMGIPAAWYVWGADAYTKWPPLRKRLFLPMTRKLLPEVGWSLWKEPLQGTYNRIRGNFRVFRHIDLCVTQLREEYELFRNTGLIDAEHAFGAVGWLEHCVDMGRPLTQVGRDILVGNSAWETSNHVDAFETLSRLNLEGRRIVVPLGYGNERYRELVLKAGEGYFGSAFAPISGILPFHEYDAIMRECGIIVMNHCRQQALGNIMAALWYGAKVYLNDTPVYRCYRRLGLDVHDIITDLVPGNSQALEPPARERVEKDREILMRELGRETIIRHTRTILDRLRQMRLTGQSPPTQRRPAI